MFIVPVGWRCLNVRNKFSVMDLEHVALHVSVYYTGHDFQAHFQSCTKCKFTD